MKLNQCELIYVIAFLDSGPAPPPGGGQSPVVHRGTFVRPSVPSGPLRPEMCPLRPEICLLILIYNHAKQSNGYRCPHIAFRRPVSTPMETYLSFQFAR